MKKSIHGIQASAFLILLALLFTTSPTGLSVVLLGLIYICIFITFTGALTLFTALTKVSLTTSRIIIYSLTGTALLALNSIERLSIAELVLIAILFSLVGLTYSKRYIDVG